MKTVPKVIIGAVVAVAVLSAPSIYHRLTAPAVDTTVAVVATVAAPLKKVKRLVVPMKQALVYAPEAKAKLKLPPAVAANADQAVTGSTTIKPSERRMTVTSVIDTATGETTTYTKPEPYPWLAVESRGGARFDYGYKLQRGALVPMPTGRLSVTHSFLQIKGMHAGVNVAIDTDGSAFAGFGLEYKW